MVKRITKVTTKKGDDGSTGMADGSRVPKSDDLINAIGGLDELNSWIGLLVSLKELEAEKDFLLGIQNCIFDIGGILTTKSIAPLKNVHTKSLEDRINKINNKLPDLDNFILPGGSKSSAFLHITRTVCRRVERQLAVAQDSQPVEENCFVYINRLSDFLFVLARKINLELNEKEFLWSQD